MEVGNPSCTASRSLEFILLYSRFKRTWRFIAFSVHKLWIYLILCRCWRKLPTSCSGIRHLEAVEQPRSINPCLLSLLTYTFSLDNFATGKKNSILSSRSPHDMPNCAGFIDIMFSVYGDKLSINTFSSLFSTSLRRWRSNLFSVQRNSPQAVIKTFQTASECAYFADPVVFHSFYSFVKLSGSCLSNSYCLLRLPLFTKRFFLPKFSFMPSFKLLKILLFLLEEVVVAGTAETFNRLHVLSFGAKPMVFICLGQWLRVLFSQTENVSSSSNSIASLHDFTNNGLWSQIMLFPLLSAFQNVCGDGDL